MRSKCLYCTLAFLFFYHGKHLFLLFSFIAVESAFKMASIQVLFNLIGLCVTTLIDPLAWIVIEKYQTINSNDTLGLYQSACNIQFIESVSLKYGIYKPWEAEHLKKKKKKSCASALVSLSDVQHPSVYKSHILNWPINKLYLPSTILHNECNKIDDTATITDSFDFVLYM